jgi:hypothetical protein
LSRGQTITGEHPANYLSQLYRRQKKKKEEERNAVTLASATGFFLPLKIEDILKLNSN